MRRGWLVFLCTLALGQVEPSDPFDRAMRLSQEARSQGNSAEAAAHREEARKLWEQTPAGTTKWEGQTQQLAQSYRSSGRTAQARAVLEDALSHGSMPDWNPVRIQFLDREAELWRQDGNLLKALPYLERAVGAAEAAPPGSVRLLGWPPVAGGSLTVVGAMVSVVGPPPTNLYNQLANLYRELGRPDAAAKTIARMRSRLQTDPRALAESYEEGGQLDEALALDQRLVADAEAKPHAQPGEIAAALENMATAYERQKRWDDAVTALQQAVARLEGSGDQSAAMQVDGLRLRIADLLQRAGQPQASEQMYQALLNQAGSDRDRQFQAAQQYTNWLADSGRGGQAAEVLKSYLAAHADLESWKESNLLTSLAEIARQAGQNDLADHYHQAAQEKQRAGQPAQLARRNTIGPAMQKANDAAYQGRIDEAVALGLTTIQSAATAPDGDEIAFRGPSLAQMLAHKAPDGADQIYRALFLVLEARSADNASPLNQALQQYARFLMELKNRWGDAALAIDRYQESAAAATGPESDALVQARRMRVDLAQMKGDPEQAVQHAEELLAQEESLSGATSTRYMRALQTAADVYQAGGKTERALAVQREIVSIADLNLSEADNQRGFVRVQAAMAFAGASQFEEAERLANEAIAIADAMQPPQPELFRSQAREIERMKAAALAPGPSPKPVVRGASGAQVRQPDGAVQP